MAIDTEIIVVGSHAPGLFLKVKRIPREGETVIGWGFQEPKDGGKGSNQAIAAALLGGKVSFVGCVGHDRIGLEGEQWMQEAGVDTTWLRKHETIASSVGFNLLDENGIPAMVTSLGANAEITSDQIDQALEAMPSAKVLLTQFEIPIEIAMYAAQKAKERGLITIINPAPAPEHQVDGLQNASILVPNESEAQVLLGLIPSSSFVLDKHILELKEKSRADCIMITLGANGVIGLDKEGIWRVNSPNVNVVDTSGAGDVFCAALAVAIVDGFDWRYSSDWAVKAASLSVTKPGTIPSYPTLSELREFINKK
jgi:ribokinase